MNTFKTYAQVDASGGLALHGLPFNEGTLVEVLVVDQSRPRQQLANDWRELIRHVQGLPQTQEISDEDIRAEIETYRSDQ